MKLVNKENQQTSWPKSCNANKLLFYVKIT